MIASAADCVPRSPTHVGLEQRLLGRLDRLELPTGTSIIVGFSGGPDSLALATLLARLARIRPISVRLVHVDHNLRPQSAADATECQRLAARLALPILVQRLDGNPVTRHPGVGLEEAARRERYLALATAAAAAAAPLIALAHTRDDQAETVLLHLLRGTGLTGAAAMAEVTEVTVPWWPANPAIPRRIIRLWRPLLDEPQSLVRSYAAAAGLTALSDESNTDRSFRRNAVRLDVMPALERVVPGASAALARYARIAAAEDEALRDVTHQILDHALDAEGGLRWSALADAPLAIQRRAVTTWLAEREPRPEISFDRVEAVLRMARTGAFDKIIQVGGGSVVVNDNGVLRAGRPEEIQATLAARFPAPLWPLGTSAPVSVTFPARHRIGDWTVVIESAIASPGTISAAGSVATNLTPSDREGLVLRAPAPGDRWARSGRAVRDWLRRQRVPALLRPRLVVLATGHRVWWIAGVHPPPLTTSQDGEDTVRVSIRRDEEEP